MPEKKTMQRARKAKRQGKAPMTQAREFVHEEIKHVREGKHGARSAKQAIAGGLSKARKAGVELPEPKSVGAGRPASRKGAASSRSTARDLAKGSSPRRKSSSKRATATKRRVRARARARKPTSR